MMRSAGTLTAVALAAALMTGCSSTSGDAGSNNEDGPVSLTYWDFMDPSQNNPRAAALKQNIENFEKENPNIDVQLSTVSFGDMISRLPQAAAAGQAPDVVKMFAPVVPQIASAQVYQPLPEEAKQITDWLRPVDKLADKDGKQVAVPYDYRTCTLYYNDKILKQIGAAVPTTWDQVADVARNAAAAGYTGFGTGFSGVDNSAIISTFFDCFMSQVGQEISNQDGKAGFDTEKGKEFADFLVKLKDAGGMSKSVVGDQYSTVSDGLQNGTVAMAVLGTERVLTLQKANPDIKSSTLPKTSNGSDTGSTFGWTLGIGAGSKYPKAAWKFIEYMTGPKAGALMATGGDVPTRSATFQEPYFTTPEAKTVQDVSKFVEQHSEPHTYPDNWIAIASGLAGAGQELYLNNRSADEFMKSAQAAANK
ncbi:ABC transporter substrate-binding protein [Paenarthrobacter sp. CM16]|uniref:ABC transporter substrate-binding protein n=1 Tax=Paenarthrobacter sp. CM16 TaxID=2738447 RepID=UPI0020A61E3E|nr:extracellular solute-binding protein [Paenarthrobacter sp. CM16]